jgi:hypothetical protein
MAKRVRTVKRVRHRLGLVVAFTGGYYFGAKAGRVRYEQLRRWLAEKKDAFAKAGRGTVNGQDLVSGTATGPRASSTS